jgi:hypothetical protein
MRKFPDWIEAYLNYSSNSEAPDQFHFWTAVSAIAGALRRQVWIDQGYFQWTPNFYIVFVAPPGIVSKSTTAAIGMNLLRDVPEIRFGPDAVTWQALTASLADAGREPLDKSTGECLPQSPITIVSSEFGTFLNPADREMVDVMVSLWDGQIGTWEKVTKTQGSDRIINPWINMIACTTPAWIAQNFPDYMIGGGFTSRTIFVWGERKRTLVAYPGNEIPENFGQLALDLTHDLEHISTLIGEFTMEPEAVVFGTEWYAQHYEESLAHAHDESKTSGYRARKQTHVHKLAMVLSASRKDELVITLDDLKRSIAYVTMLEADMDKVFGMIGRSQAARSTEEVVGIVRKFKVIDLHILYRELYKILSKKEIDDGLEAAIEAKLVKLFAKDRRTLIMSEEMAQQVHGASSSQASSMD